MRDAVRVGHSTGGGEVAHYIGQYGESRVAKAVLISSVPPLMVQTEANPGGLPKSVFDDLQASWRPTGPSSTGRCRRARSTASTARARRAPRAIICLISAASLWDLTDELPSAVNIAVPRGTRPPQITFPPVGVSRFEAATFDLGPDGSHGH